MFVRSKSENNNNQKPEVSSNLTEKGATPQSQHESLPKQPGSQQFGSVSLSTKHINQRSRDMSVYYQLKNPVTNIVENISANAVVHSLGFARFNAGTKKKVRDNHGQVKSKLVRTATILDYKDYCLHRKLKKLLESGGVVLKEEAEKYWVVTDQPICVFYTNTHAQDSQFTKGIDKKSGFS